MVNLAAKKGREGGQEQQIKASHVREARYETWGYRERDGRTVGRKEGERIIRKKWPPAAEGAEAVREAFFFIPK